jgi:hypothetical protein
MSTSSYAAAKTLSYAIIAAGLALAFVSSFIPFFNASYHLKTGILLAGMSPYLIYSIIAVLLRSWLTTVVGLIILALHMGLIFQQRFISNANNIEMIYYGAVALCVLLTPLMVVALRQPWRR